MSAASADRRRIMSADELFDEARAMAENSADPAATYEGFLRGLEMGLSAGTLSPVLSKAIGNKLADMRTPQPADPIASSETATIPDPRGRAVRRASEHMILKDRDFPTEWTLEP